VASIENARTAVLASRLLIASPPHERRSAMANQQKQSGQRRSRQGTGQGGQRQQGQNRQKQQSN
jgi:hypothetical protein